MNTGSILDFYDDPNGFVLREKIPEAGLPEFVKEASFLDEQRRASLPDDVFAVVMLDQGEPIRKFACVDKGNTALSVIYFMENRHKLPEEAQKVAAANLITACGWYDIEPPESLLKTAGLLGKVVGAPMKALTALSGVAQAKDVASRGAARHAATMGKFSELSGTKLLPNQSDRPEDEEKTASIQPYVDITGKEAPPRIEKVASRRTLLNGNFPVDTYGEVEQAQRWFNDYGTTLHPADRREYCVKLAERADELGAEVDGGIAKYAASGYAPDHDIEMAVSTRLQFWTEDSPHRDLLAGLMQKRASIEPETFCEALRQIDEMSGLHYHWDNGVVDPWFSTFGKTAGVGWSFEYGGDKIDEEKLHSIVMAQRCQLKKLFGEDVAEEMEKKPKEIFDSLPLDSKRIIMRMANDPQP